MQLVLTVAPGHSGIRRYSFVFVSSNFNKLYQFNIVTNWNAINIVSMNWTTSFDREIIPVTNQLWKRIAGGIVEIFCVRAMSERGSRGKVRQLLKNPSSSDLRPSVPANSSARTGRFSYRFVPQLCVSRTFIRMFNSTKGSRPNHVKSAETAFSPMVCLYCWSMLISSTYTPSIIQPSLGPSSIGSAESWLISWMRWLIKVNKR